MSYIGNTPTVNNPVSESDLESGLKTKLNSKVTGPASSVDNTLPRFDGTTGKLIQGSSIYVDDSGNVGVGNTPDATGRLSIYGAASGAWPSTASGLTLNGASSGESTITSYLDTSVITIGAGVTQKTGITINGQTSASGSSIDFRTGGSARMRIDTAGNVGIGKASPGAKLDWRDTVNVVSTGTIAVASNTYVLTASMTLTLPPIAYVGDWIRVVNRSGTLTCVIARNGHNIMGLAEDMTLDNLNASTVLIFADATRGWIWA